MYLNYKWNLFFSIFIGSLLLLIPINPSYQIDKSIQEIISKIPDQEVVKKTVNIKHLHCLADNIFHEAGGEPFMGQVAVARVVMNRIKHGFAPNPCQVIYQSSNVPDPENEGETKKVCQFSWVCAGKDSPPKSNPKYQTALEIARKILEEDKWREDIPNNILFFHNTDVNPLWRYKEAMTIGNHVFYSYGREKHK